MLGDPRREEARGGRWRGGIADLMEVSGLTLPPPHRQHPGHLCGLGGGTRAAMSFTTCPEWGRIPVLVPQPGSRLLHCFSGPHPSGQALPRPWEAQKRIQAHTAGKLLFVAGRVQGRRRRAVLVCRAGSALQVPELEGVQQQSQDRIQETPERWTWLLSLCSHPEVLRAGQGISRIINSLTCSTPK